MRSLIVVLAVIVSLIVPLALTPAQPAEAGTYITVLTSYGLPTGPTQTSGSCQAGAANILAQIVISVSGIGDLHQLTMYVDAGANRYTAMRFTFTPTSSGTFNVGFTLDNVSPTANFDGSVNASYPLTALSIVTLEVANLTKDEASVLQIEYDCSSGTAPSDTPIVVNQTVPASSLYSGNFLPHLGLVFVPNAVQGHVGAGSEIWGFFTNDLDGDGGSTFVVSATATVDGVKWYGLYVGGRTLLWVRAADVIVIDPIVEISLLP